MQTGLQPRPRYSRPLLPPSLVLGQGDAGPPPERIGFCVSPCPSILPHPHPEPAMVDPDELRRRLTMIGVSEPPTGAVLDHLAARLMEASPGLLPVRRSAIARAAATTSCARRAATRSTRTARSTCFPFLLAKDPRSQHQQHPKPLPCLIYMDDTQPPTSSSMKCHQEHRPRILHPVQAHQS